MSHIITADGQRKLIDRGEILHFSSIGGSGIIGDVGSTDNTIVRANGSGGATVQGGSFATVSDVGIISSLGLDLQGLGRIDLDADNDTSIRSAGDDTIDFEVGGTDRAELSSAALSMAVPVHLDGNDLSLNSTNVTNIRGTPSTMVFEVNNTEVAQFTSSALDMNASDLEIADGKKIYLDTDKDTYIYCITDDLMAFYVGGALVFTSNATATSFTQDLLLASGKSLQCNGTARVDFDADEDTSIRSSADDLLDFEAGGADVMQLSATALDGTDTLRIKGFAGHRDRLFAVWWAVNTAAARQMYSGGAALVSWTMERAGSIIGLGASVNIDAISSGDCHFRVYKNGSYLTGCQATVASPVVADDQKATATFAQGTYTFAAEDQLTIYRVRTTGTLTTDDMNCSMSLEYDS